MMSGIPRIGIPRIAVFALAAAALLALLAGAHGAREAQANRLSPAQTVGFMMRATEACPTLDPTDEMVRVGGVCIDKYEASLWDAPVGGNQITINIPCSPTGEDCGNIYARSVAGVEPVVGITWFQARQALANSGKRLPTPAEWEMAAAGTPDPGASPGGQGCNTQRALAFTGEREACVSRWGIHDLRGNVWEWAAQGGDRTSSATSAAFALDKPSRALLPWESSFRVGFRGAR